MSFSTLRSCIIFLSCSSYIFCRLLFDSIAVVIAVLFTNDYVHFDIMLMMMMMMMIVGDDGKSCCSFCYCCCCNRFINIIRYRNWCFCWTTVADVCYVVLEVVCFCMLLLLHRIKPQRFLLLWCLLLPLRDNSSTFRSCINISIITSPYFDQLTTHSSSISHLCLVLLMSIRTFLDDSIRHTAFCRHGDTFWLSYGSILRKIPFSRVISTIQKK